MCSICDATFAYPREFALLVSTVGLPEPKRCPAGCEQDVDAESPAPLSPTERSLATLWQQLYAKRIASDHPVIKRLPREPEELFKPDMGRSRDEDPAGPQFDDVPSPDALFQGLGGSSSGEKG